MLKGIYSRIRYMGRKRELEECKRSDQRVQKGIPMRYGRCGKIRTRRRNV